MQYPMRHLHRYGRQLDDLMRMVRRGHSKGRVATCTLLRPQLLDYCRRQEHLTMARMARFATCFPVGDGGRTLARLLVGRV